MSQEGLVIPRDPGPERQAPTARRWSSLGAGLYCALAVATDVGRLILFVRRADGNLCYRPWSCGAWGELRSVGVPTARDAGGSDCIPIDWELGGCAVADGAVQLFGRSPEGVLLHLTFVEGARPD